MRGLSEEGLAAAAIIKHTNPCGAALAPSLAEAFGKARAGDPISAFGGILATSQPIDAATAELITGKNTFFEAVIAPGYDAEAFKILTEKKQWGANLILLELPLSDAAEDGGWDYKRVGDGFLAQTPDAQGAGLRDLETVTRRDPTPAEVDDLLFAWKVVKHVKSNAIVLAKDRQIVGVGAGQNEPRPERPAGCGAGRRQGTRGGTGVGRLFSRSRTARRRPARRAWRRSSSPAGPRRTPTPSSWRTLTRWRWSSPATAISGTEVFSKPGYFLEQARVVRR